MTERSALVGAVLLACLAGEAGAAQQPEDAFTASVYTGFEHSENAIRRSDGNSADITRLGLSADLNGERRRMDYSLTGNISWAGYSGYELPNALEGGMFGLMHLGAEDALLRWTVQDSIRQSLKAPEGNVTPDNSEFVNNLSTGPTLTFRLGDRAALTMSGLYSRLSYEDSPLDANTLSGTVGISTALPGDGSLGLFGRVAGTSGVAGESGYDLRSAYVRYQRGLQSSNSLSLDAGYIESLHEGVTSGGPLVLLSLQRQISGLSSVFLNASRTITNTAEIRAIEALGTAEHDRPISQPGSVESSGADAGWKVGGRRNTLALGGGWRKEEYNSAPQFDRKVSYVSATFSRRLRSTLTANLDVRYNTEDFADPTLPEFDYQTVVLSLQQMFGRRLSGGLTTVYSHRSDKVASGYEFTEWRYGLTIGYLLTEPTR